MPEKYLNTYLNCDFIFLFRDGGCDSFQRILFFDQETGLFNLQFGRYSAVGLPFFKTDNDEDYLIYYCYKVNEDATCGEDYRQVMWLSRRREITVTNELRVQMAEALRAACMQVGELRLVEEFQG